MGAYLDALHVVTEACPLGDPLPDIDLRLHGALPEAEEVTEAIRGAAGVVLNLASQHIEPERIMERAVAGRLDLQVLLVPPRSADSSTPQFGLAQATMGVSMEMSGLAVRGSRPQEPTAEVRAHRIGALTAGHNIWLPDSAAAGTQRLSYSDYRIEPLPPEWMYGHTDQRGGFGRLVQAADYLGELARVVDARYRDGLWRPQVLLSGRVVS